MNMKKYLILGFGIAALSAIRAIRSIDGEGEITAISGECHPPYSKVLLTHYIAGHLPLEKLEIASREEIEKLHINVVFGHMAMKADTEKREVVLDDGRIYRYDSLLIATGSSPVIKDAPEGCDYTGLRTIEEAAFIAESAKKGKKILISGGGLVGVKLACALKNLGYDTQIIIASSQILSQVADKEAGGRIAGHMRANGIGIITGANIVGTETGKSGRTVRLSDGAELWCDLIVYCKGVRANLDFLDPVQYGDCGIEVDQYMKTAIYEVYAAGDVTCSPEIITGARANLSIWPHAVEQGTIAGLNMVGHKTVYRGSLSRNALEILGMPYICVGAVNDKKHDETEVDCGKGYYRKLAYQNGKLVGALLYGEVYEAGRLQAAIRKQNEPLYSVGNGE